MNSSPESTAEPFQASLPSFTDVEAAAERLAGHAVATPLLNSPALDRRVGGRVLLKAETLQRTGSFKFRGAYNRISRIPEDARPAGVVAYSSGNHAQGVAAAAALLGVPATIVMPKDAPAIKLANTRGYGAEVVLYDRFTEVREEIGAEIAARRGATIVRPFDDPAIIAGQGTCGLEIARQAAAVDAELDAVLICCGGGGLTAGCALALAELSPRTAIYTVEPEAFDDTARSLAGGARVARPGRALVLRRAASADARRIDLRHQPPPRDRRVERRRRRGRGRYGLCLQDPEAGGGAGRRRRLGRAALGPPGRAGQDRGAHVVGCERGSEDLPGGSRP